MTDAEERQRIADTVILSVLCRFSDDYPTPSAWLCRLAWFTYTLGQPFDVDAAIADRLDWLNQPEHADTRANLVGCCEYIKGIAERRPKWDVPDNPFDPTEWFTATTCNAPDTCMCSCHTFGILASAHIVACCTQKEGKTT